MDQSYYGGSNTFDQVLTLLSVLSVSLICSEENGTPSSFFPVLIVVLDVSRGTW